MDILHKATTWVDHNRYVALVGMIALATVIWIVGCQATTESVLHEGTQVTKVELEREAISIVAEYEARVATLELAQADIERKEAARAMAVQVLAGLATSLASGTVTPASGINIGITLLGLIGLGAVADNRRKDSLLKKKKEG